MKHLAISFIMFKAILSFFHTNPYIFATFFTRSNSQGLKIDLKTTYRKNLHFHWKTLLVSGNLELELKIRAENSNKNNFLSYPPSENSDKFESLSFPTSEA